MFPGEVPDLPPNEDDLALFDTMRKYWTSFVTSGVPEAQDAPIWDKVSNGNSGSRRILLQPGQVAMENVGKDLAHRCNTWHGLSGEMQV